MRLIDLLDGQASLSLAAVRTASVPTTSDFRAKIVPFCLKFGDIRILHFWRA